MAKMESSLKNMLLSLTCITLVAAAALAGIYMLTFETIEQQKAEAETQAKLSVLAGDENGTPILVESTRMRSLLTMEMNTVLARS